MYESTIRMEPWGPHRSETDREAAAPDLKATMIASQSAQIKKLAAEWAEVQPQVSAAAHEARIRSEILLALEGLEARWKRKYPNRLHSLAPQIIAALVESKRNKMLASAPLPGVRPLGAFKLPVKLDTLVVDPFVEESSKAAPVAREVVEFLKALKAKYPAFRAETYRNHGGAGFLNKGYSVDIDLTSAKTKEGFYTPADAIRFLTALDAMAKERKFGWRVLYNDFRVISALNRALGLRRVVYVDGVFRDPKTKQISGLNWHGPDPLILHMHLDLVPEGTRSLGDSIRRVVEDVGTGLAAGRDALLLSALIARGERDPGKLASEVFYARHPERNRRPLDKSEKQEVAEWILIRDQVVRPFLARQGSSSEWERESLESEGGLSGVLGNVVNLGRELMLLSSLIQKGETDPSKLASEVFYARHPERNRQPLGKSETQSIAEWLSIRDQQVTPLLERLRSASQAVPKAGPNPAPKPATTTAEANIAFSTAGWGGWKGLSSASGTKLPVSLATDPYTIAVAVTSTIEGSFDKVQTYDRGILSFGIKQWTLHAGSLQKMLAFMRQELTSAGKADLWQDLFPGIEVRGGNVLSINGKSYQSQAELMQLIRNTTSQTAFDRPHMERWMRMFVRAGRNPTIQALQLKHAANELRQVLTTPPLVQAAKLPFPRMQNVKPIGHYLQGNTRALAFFQSMYTQNPSWAKAHVGTVVQGLLKRLGPESGWPADWGAQFLADYENLFKSSGVACWGTRALSKKDCSGRQSRYNKTIAGLARYAP